MLEDLKIKREGLIRLYYVIWASCVQTHEQLVDISTKIKWINLLKTHIQDGI